MNHDNLITMSQQDHNCSGNDPYNKSIYHFLSYNEYYKKENNNLVSLLYEKVYYPNNGCRVIILIYQKNENIYVY